MTLDLNKFDVDMTAQGSVSRDKKIRVGIIGTGGIARSGECGHDVSIEIPEV